MGRSRIASSQSLGHSIIVAALSDPRGRSEPTRPPRPESRNGWRSPSHLPRRPDPRRTRRRPAVEIAFGMMRVDFNGLAVIGQSKIATSSRRIGGGTLAIGALQGAARPALSSAIAAPASPCAAALPLGEMVGWGRRRRRAASARPFACNREAAPRSRGAPTASLRRRMRAGVWPANHLSLSGPVSWLSHRATLASRRAECVALPL